MQKVAESKVPGSGEGRRGAWQMGCWSRLGWVYHPWSLHTCPWVVLTGWRQWAKPGLERRPWQSSRTITTKPTTFRRKLSRLISNCLNNGNLTLYRLSDSACKLQMCVWSSNFVRTWGKAMSATVCSLIVHLWVECVYIDPYRS